MNISVRINKIRLALICSLSSKIVMDPLLLIEDSLINYIDLQLNVRAAKIPRTGVLQNHASLKTKKRQGVLCVHEPLSLRASRFHNRKSHFSFRHFRCRTCQSLHQGHHRREGCGKGGRYRSAGRARTS